MARVPHDPNELIALVDENDNVIGKAPRRNHAGGKLHREVSVFIINSNNEILLQTRKDNGKIDYSASGHFPYDQEYLPAAVRETDEELGIKIDPSKFTLVDKRRYTVRLPDFVNDCIVSLFEVTGDYKINELKIDPLEVESVRYYSVNEIIGLLEGNKEKGRFMEALSLYMQKKGFIG